MTKTLEELIDKAFKMKCYFKLDSYELHQYEDGSYCDFHVQKVIDLPTLLYIAGGLELNFYNSDDYMIVRLTEREAL